MPAQIAAKVASAMIGPAHAFVDASLPCVDTSIELITAAKASRPTPYSAILRAFVEENNETNKTNKIGLTNHIGRNPPGSPKTVLTTPAPGIAIPGSTKNRLG